MRPRYAAFVVLLSAMLMTLCFVEAEPVFAEYEDYDTNEFNVDARIDEDHTIHVTETIKVDFNQSAHHGIMRYIPFADKLYQIHGIDVEGWEYSVDSEHWPSGNGYKVIRIGSADELVSGPQTFRLHYDLKCFRDDQPDADYLSFDMLPTGWNTPIAKATCTLRLPKAIDWKALKLYSGQYGEKADASQYFDVIRRQERLPINLECVINLPNDKVAKLQFDYHTHSTFCNIIVWTDARESAGEGGYTTLSWDSYGQVPISAGYVTSKGFAL